MLAITSRDSRDSRHWVFFTFIMSHTFFTYRMSIDIAGIPALKNELIIVANELRNVLGSRLMNNEQVSR